MIWILHVFHFLGGQVAVICVTQERISVKETSYKFNSSYNAKQFNLTSHDFDTYNHTQLNHTLSNISSTASLTNVTRISNTTSKNLTLENVNISISNFLFLKHIPESDHERETVAISFKKASCQTNHYVTKTEDTEIIFNLTECLNGTQKSVSTFNYTKTSHAVVLTNTSETARGDLSVKKLLSKIEWQNVSTTLNSFSVTAPSFTFSQQSLVTITLDSVITMNTSSYFRTEIDGGKATTPHYKVSMNTNPMRSTDRNELSTTVTKPSNKRVSAKSLLQTKKELTTHQSVLNSEKSKSGTITILEVFGIIFLPTVGGITMCAFCVKRRLRRNIQQLPLGSPDIVLNVVASDDSLTLRKELHGSDSRYQ